MKFFIVFTALFLFAGGIFTANAMDLIILRDGTVIEAQVIEISPTEIRYRRFDHLDGPIIVIPAANVLSIRYASGRIEMITAAPAPATAQGATRQAHFGQRDRFLSGSIAYTFGIALGINYERKFDRVSWGFDTFFAAGEIFAFAGAATFKFFPAPIFFLGADLGLSLWEGRNFSSFGAQFAPQLGFRLGGQDRAFFSDIFVAVPMHIGDGGARIIPRTGTRIGGAW